MNIMKALNGKKEANKILAEIRKGVKKAKKKPFLAVVLVGDDKASKLYVKLKKEAAKKVGIGFRLCKFNEDDSQIDIESKIMELNEDKKISGIIVQLPIPKIFNTQKIINTIAPEKDVDGFHPINEKLFLRGKERFIPVFPNAIFRMLKSSGQKLKNKKAILIINSEKFGKLMKVMLERNGMEAEYILAKKFKDNPQYIKNYQIIITAVGIPNLINGSIIKKGCIIIDGGIAKENGKTVGDVDWNSVKKTASFISPVPGGVGPLTVAGLLENVYLASLKNNETKK